MTSTQDCALLAKKETTYRTGVTPDRSFEYTEEGLDWNKNVVQGQGLRAGSRVARSGRRVVPTADGSGPTKIECISRGMGYLWELCLGAGVSTMVSGSTFQQNFTLGDTPPSATVQKQLYNVGSGTVDPFTFLGCMVDQWDVAVDNAGIATLSITWNCGDITTATAAAANAYPSAAANLFHFANAAISNGTFTAPTTTALATAASPLASVRSFALSVKNNLAADRYNMGGAGRKDKPTVGLREITGQVVVENSGTAFRDALLNETPMPLVVNLTAGALSTGLETLQFALPEVKFDTELAKTNGTDLINMTMGFTVLDNLTAAQPIWVCQRTADTAL